MSPAAATASNGGRKKQGQQQQQQQQHSRPGSAEARAGAGVDASGAAGASFGSRAAAGPAAAASDDQEAEFLALLGHMGLAAGPPAVSPQPTAPASAPPLSAGAQPAAALLAAQRRSIGVQCSLLQPEEEGCVVCMEGRREVLLLPCRHLALCAACAHGMLGPGASGGGGGCPICRVPVAQSIQCLHP